MKKKILFLIPTLGHGGAEKVLVNLVNHLDRDRFDVTVQTLFDEGENKQYLAKEICYRTFLPHSFRGNNTLFSHIPSKWLYRLIVKEKYDVVISYLEGPTTHIISGCPYPDTKKVSWVHTEMSTDRMFSIGFCSKKQAVEAYQKMDRVIFVSENLKKIFAEVSGTSFCNLQVLYNTNETDDILEKAQEPMTDFSFAADEINVISVGKLIPVKGYDRLAKVHKRLRDEGICHHIYLLGVGKEQKSIERYLEENGLQDSFTLLGYRDNPYKYVKAADLFICSSRVEGFSTAVTESLIVGTPVVSTDCSGMRELLGEQDEYGLVVENTEDGLYKGLKRMLSDAKLREYYGVQAKERGTFFSTVETVCAVERMLDSL